MPKITKQSVLDLLKTRYNSDTHSRDLLYDDTVVGSVVTCGSSDPRFKVGGNVSSKAVYIFSGVIEGIRFRQEGASSKSAIGKVATLVSRELNAKPTKTTVTEDEPFSPKP